MKVVHPDTVIFNSMHDQMVKTALKPQGNI